MFIICKPTITQLNIEIVRVAVGTGTEGGGMSGIWPSPLDFFKEISVLKKREIYLLL